MEEKLEGVDLSTMAGRIRHYRVKKGIGQLEMGRRLGNSCGLHGKWERGQQVPGRNSVRKILERMDKI